MKSNNAIKHCEFCGIHVNDPFWSAIFSIDYIIFLKNEMVHRVDYKKQEVYLTDGNILDFAFDYGNERLSMPKYGKIHLLCSEACEDKFLSQNKSGIMSESIYQDTPIFSFKENNIFKPATNSITQLRTIKKECQICYCEYPELDDNHYERKWLIKQIIQKDKEYVTNNSLSSFKTDEYGMIMSGINNQNPNGFYYGYKLGEGYETNSSICSNDCAFSYSKSNNCHMVTLSVLDKDCLGAIVPETEEFNKNLNNPIPHRPNFYKYL